MCDTILAPPSSTAERLMLFGKNSDRQRNEAQAVDYCKRADHPPGAQLACTHITIPQARRTHAVLLCRPFWMWGAEMGANEHGVAIGNQALDARVPAEQSLGLIGMDLLRLALERAVTAAEAVHVIVALLEQHGQGGNCGYLKPSFYHNGFLIADPREAYVLETVGKEWLVEQVSGVRTISNVYSIERDPHSTSPGLGALGRDSNYAQALADPQRQHIGNAAQRRACSTSLLRAHEPRLDATDMMSVLRDHGRFECILDQTLCMHAGADDRPAQTVGSMVSELHSTGAVHWVTGTAAPCISIYKPVLLGTPLPSRGPSVAAFFDPQTLWWRHERLHRRAVLTDFADFLQQIRPERDALEAQFHAHMRIVANAGTMQERAEAVALCWGEAMETEDRWLSRIGKAAILPNTPDRAAWLTMNRLAGL